ncbi:lung adenoma susceptibility protein 2 [Rana temporaria]|uniref:lung adenoma susceptibility protein 2 n=1 Tax=Rana temporaria TaxID=8407 RepID=UPI001AACDBBC|nr:lung adenoma susceptibility protein 2 [Rana temporaria]
MAGSTSPDSSLSISSLLASCRLENTKGSSSFSSSVEYKEKLYDSATQALEDYIEDFEESLRSPLASTGKIHIHSTAALGSPKTKGAADRNFRPKHLSRRRSVARDPDLLSLTTDDLLGFPSDGSLPFSQVSHWKQCEKSRNNYYGPSLPSRTSPLRSSLNTRPHRYSLRHDSQTLDLQRLGEDVKENKTNVLREMERENRPAYYNNLNSPYLSRGSEVLKSYPRWLTSQKSELSVSGITSIPDVKYPLWIKDYGLLLGDSQSAVAKNTYSKASANETFVHGSSPLGSLRSLFHDRHGKEAVNVTSASRKFYSGLSDLDVRKNLHSPPKNHPADSPLWKSQAFESPLKGFPDPPENNGSPRTEDVLEAERSWEKIPYSFKSPVTIPCKDEINEEFAAPLTSRLVEDFLQDKVKEESKASSFSGGNHHGPVEALKHMLFNLQTFQQNFTEAQTSKQVEEFQKVYTEAESEIQRVDQEAFPVNKSLQKALQHLSRLKELVGDGTTKQD